MNVTENLLTPLLELYSATSTRLNLRSGNFSWTGRNLTQSIDEDHRGNEWLTTSTGSGSLESSSFDGRVDYGTITPLLSIDGDYPASGVVRIDGLNGSSIVVTALNEETLQLAIDINGDTVVDETRLLDWSEVDVF
jgi:hypothetical protein